MINYKYYVQVVGEEIIVNEKDTSFEDDMNTTISIEYTENPTPLSTENATSQKWLSNDVNKEDLLVNIIRYSTFYDKRLEYIMIIM